MSMKKIIPFGLALLFFSVAAFASWYEGSELVDNTFEWKHTAIITSWINNGEVERGNISQLDFFIYSIKFKPIFPIIMLGSLLYMLVIIGKKIIRQDRFVNLYVVSLGIFLVIVAAFLMDSPTAGAKAFMFSQLVIAGFLIVYSILRSTRKIQAN
ncbi:YjdJ family protein [Sutcliffiella horikoshii]|uniref:DUF4306 domain-containing protein n=1 Tax=Sutcliffiella horikoshii TaxID=79883 RepID=UPI00203E0182|nr:DUF4306 domain-containing protein [Sutcliffiella horikoshii]MCM3617503.1 YjdJ family protein [Sutcliffiella horikoshii]